MVSLCSQLAVLSSNQAGLTTSNFLTYANMVLMELTAELVSKREEYLIWTDAIPVTAGNPYVRIPYRATNGTIRHLWWEDGSGSRTRLWGRSIEDMENYSINDKGVVTGFYIEGNYVVLLQTPATNGTLQVAYPFQPSLLVDQNTTQAIASVGTNSVTLNNIPINFVSGGTFDIIDHLSGNGILYYDLTGTISGNTITFPNAIPNVSVNNWIAQAGQTPVPMIPEAGHPLLLESTVLRLEIIRGQKDRIKNSQDVVADARKAWDMLLTNRVFSKPQAAGGGGAQRPMRPWSPCVD